MKIQVLVQGLRFKHRLGSKLLKGAHLDREALYGLLRGSTIGVITGDTRS